jgi:hypothetical protein
MAEKIKPGTEWDASSQIVMPKSHDLPSWEIVPD